MAQEYALVAPDNSIPIFNSSVDPNVATKPGFRWLPVITTDPPCDTATQIKTGPVITVLANSVTRVYTVRAKTQQELDDDLALAQQQTLDIVGEVGKKALYILDTRYRILTGLPLQTETQFYSTLKILLGINPPAQNTALIGVFTDNTPSFIKQFSTTINIGSVAAASSTDKSFNVPGLLANDTILSVNFTKGLVPNTITVMANTVSTNTLNLRFSKISTGAVTPPASQPITVTVLR
jgi:hypothetical protein